MGDNLTSWISQIPALLKLSQSIQNVFKGNTAIFKDLYPELVRVTEILDNIEVVPKIDEPGNFTPDLKHIQNCRKLFHEQITPLSMKLLQLRIPLPTYLPISKAEFYSTFILYVSHWHITLRKLTTLAKEGNLKDARILRVPFEDPLVLKDGYLKMGLPPKYGYVFQIRELASNKD